VSEATIESETSVEWQSTDEHAITEESLMTEWLSPQGAAQLAGVSYGWIRLLGERGRIATLNTPLGRLYRRRDVEDVWAERERAGTSRRR
jgi:hypothetical protein